jgi:glycerol dehydrogenase-like iron-containing ADH family enzyme
MVIGGHNSLNLIDIQNFLANLGLEYTSGYLAPDCCESSLEHLQQQASENGADVVIGIGGGKVLDAAKLVAYRTNLPVVTIPTSAATCAAWTALSNVYSPTGGFLYDVGLDRCPDLLILDYRPIATAPEYTLVAGIGDAIAKWYEASVSSGNSTQTLTIAAVQQARVLRDILFQKSLPALQHPGGVEWQEVVDATVLLAGVIGGLGGAQCRTVAAHAVHNGLTHIHSDRPTIHGEKVAYGILVQLRLEEMLADRPLAATARQQLLDFYTQLNLPKNSIDLGLAKVSDSELQRAAEIACRPTSDLHHLPFPVTPAQLIEAMLSTDTISKVTDFLNSTAGITDIIPST